MPTLSEKAKVKQESESKEAWIDDTFRIEKHRWGTWSSYDKEGNCIVTALEENLCRESTRFYLKGKQEGFQDDGVSYTGVVGGKL